MYISWINTENTNEIDVQRIIMLLYLCPVLYIDQPESVWRCWKISES